MHRNTYHDRTITNAPPPRASWHPWPSDCRALSACQSAWKHPSRPQPLQPQRLPLRRLLLRPCGAASHSAVCDVARPGRAPRGDREILRRTVVPDFSGRCCVSELFFCTIVYFAQTDSNTTQHISRGPHTEWIHLSLAAPWPRAGKSEYGRACVRCGGRARRAQRFRARPFASTFGC